jgi:hypothetical protein
MLASTVPTLLGKSIPGTSSRNFTAMMMLPTTWPASSLEMDTLLAIKIQMSGSPKLSST